MSRALSRLGKHEPPNLLGGSCCVIHTGLVRAGTFVQVLCSDLTIRVTHGCLVCVEPPASLICFQREVGEEKRTQCGDTVKSGHLYPRYGRRPIEGIMSEDSDTFLDQDA